MLFCDGRGRRCEEEEYFPPTSKKTRIYKTKTRKSGNKNDAMRYLYRPRNKLDKSVLICICVTLISS